MKGQEYVQKAVMTESNDFTKLGERLSLPRNIRLLHATIGAMTEIGELFEMLENENIDLTNLQEEVGDVTWYVAIACHEMNWSLEEFIPTANPSSGKDIRPQIEKELIKMVQCGAKALDLMKKSSFYGKPLDEEKMKKEMKDLVKHSVHLLSVGGFDIEGSFAINIKKLHDKRFKGGKFSETEAVHRNLEEERKTLEGKD